MGDSVLSETVVIFASLGVFLLAAAALLLRRRMRATAMRVAAIRGGSHIPLSTGIWTPKVIALYCVGVTIMFLYFGSVDSFLKNDTRHAIWFLVVCAGLTIIFFQTQEDCASRDRLSVLCGWSYPISVGQPTVLGWTITLSSGALLLALVIWLTNKYPDMKRRDFKKLFDRDPD